MRRKLSLFLYFTLIIFLTVVLVFQGADLIISARKDYVDSVEHRAEEVIKAYDNELNFYLDMNLNISTNPLIVEVLQFEEGHSISEAYNDITFISKYFSSFKEIENYMPDQLCVYSVNRFPLDNAYIKNVSELKKKDVWEKLNDAKDNRYVWEYTLTDSGKGYLSLYSQILKSNTVLGWLETKIPYAKIVYNFESFELNKGESLALNSFEGETIYKTADSFSGKKIEKIAINGDGFEVYAKVGNGLHGIYGILLWLIAIYIIFIIAIKIISQKVVTSMTKEFDDFIRFIRSDDNLLYNSQLIEVDGDDEIGQIKNKFKDLLIRNNSLHEKVEKANSEKKHAELNFLQYSINPHLLYNTLSCIKWCIMEKSEEDIGNIIDDLSAYYCLVLSGGENFITLSEEVALVERYVKLMSAVYGTDVSLEYEIHDNLKDTYIIKMLLQPIVENSILHGLNGIENAKVSISIGSAEENVIELTVKDNGYGMDEDTVGDLLKDKGERRHHGYGISNVIKRINCYYGDIGSLKVYSEINCGTTVAIRIKKVSDLSELE